MRTLAWFSAGAASAVATKLALAMWHTCRPPGRPAKVTQLIAVDNDGETKQQAKAEPTP